jgi:hypothetical protein
MRKKKFVSRLAGSLGWPMLQCEMRWMDSLSGTAAAALVTCRSAWNG